MTKFQQHFTLISKYSTRKRWHVPHPSQSSMHLKNKVKGTIPKFLQILETRIYLIIWIYYKITLPRREFTYTYEISSIHRLIPIVRINHCIESQAGNKGSLTMHITANIKQYSYINKHVISTGVWQINTYLERCWLTTTRSAMMQCYSIQNCRLDYNGSKRRLNLFSRAEIICKDNGGNDQNMQ